jgi:hypothetical protein
MGAIIGLKGFLVAIIAGIANARGVVIAGLLYGVAEKLIEAYLSTAARDAIAAVAKARKSGSHVTRRWREPDSNPQSPQEDGYFESAAEELMPCSSSSARSRSSPALRGVAQRTAAPS